MTRHGRDHAYNYQAQSNPAQEAIHVFLKDQGSDNRAKNAEIEAKNAKLKPKSAELAQILKKSSKNFNSLNSQFKFLRFCVVTMSPGVKGCLEPLLGLNLFNSNIDPGYPSQILNDPTRLWSCLQLPGPVQTSSRSNTCFSERPGSQQLGKKWQIEAKNTKK